MNDAFRRVIGELGQSLWTTVVNEIGAENWDRATLDVRFTPNENSWMSKIRATQEDMVERSIGMSNLIDQHLFELSAMRDCLGETWYGLVVSVTRDRECSVNLNYDPRCAEDETFFE